MNFGIWIVFLMVYASIVVELMDWRLADRKGFMGRYRFQISEVFIPFFFDR